ncbi:MAG: selenide, water dikinase SelD [Gemmatimonadota bacterium]|nr:MAG: selenide, water dikinase SelD [Gemmatimonadota bacterium]
MTQVLRHVPMIDDSRVLIDAASRDDAAVYQVTEDRAIVVSVDFFAPIVDDPYSFGAIAAANALSDIYAMGATPRLALNLVAWPRDPDLLQLLGETLRGGLDVLSEAGAFLVGGHSIDDREPKYGMVTIGEVHPSKVISITGAEPGDRLVLTKPLGTGILSTAVKRDLIAEHEIESAVSVMSRLNAGAAAAMLELGTAVHAATDVTGFGLLGHLRNMLNASRVSARISISRVPALDGARDLAEQDAVPGGTLRNLESVSGVTSWPDDIARADQLLLSDAQTSGGLLIAIAASRVDDLVTALRENDTPAHSVVGEVTREGTPLIRVDNN